ncbi:XRE family transcriptional regulator [Weissella muntiaci]|uniref:XRE family transcriptional regulator n=1 Tax=Weissella muntiaci TaxID=2508881 RepID=A0A6C2C755_9LACO|nr:helix-turn-helix transcriptional regulator [Weissella muntiaci]TYC49647.1 XRE family transcriptional regulator [Weissella muntiaci]
MNVVERIKNTAKSRSMTIKDLSLRAGIGPQTIYNWRDRNPQTETLQKVADILNVSVDYLLGNTDEATPIKKDRIKVNPAEVKVLNKIETAGLNEKQLEQLDSYLDFITSDFIKRVEDDLNK